MTTQSEHQSGAKRVLFVEDDVLLQDIMGRALRSAGFDFFAAMSGKEALELIDKQLFDLILLDIILPGIDGFEILGNLRKNPKTLDIKIIILSNLSSPEDVRRGLELGALYYLVKAKYSPSEIVEHVKRVLSAPQKSAT